ncbi:hypothetical protein GCM10010869_19090 [Mesorhizobium tianshanense]|uniref:Putative membrane protein n=1 Tax=Mesorhizobium tianshanense TaxID=39844 RepID=A0A562N3Y1_9HYPH|nr:EamA family transporter [Mesorhizobium tianshanense]TWI26793.1 putative membrane protein [Mesorhizobium tianshanense]GLS36320.1 hypothetical protein GCM10010869_19090 [Mesorhizobium tianshanense]
MLGRQSGERTCIDIRARFIPHCSAHERDGRKPGLFFIGLDRVDAAGGGIRGVLLVRATAFVATVAVTLRCRGEAMHPRSLGIAAGAGLLDRTANLLLMMAFATGGLAETSTIASLYPVATIFLAIAALRERRSRSQAIGLLLVIPAIFLLKSS